MCTLFRWPHSVTCRLLFWIVLLCASYAPVAWAQTWHWTLEDVDFQGEGTAIIADRDGNIHLSYYMAVGGQLKYAFLPAGDSKWYKMTIDKNLNSMDTGITVDRNGNPQICYTPASIRYARWDGKIWSSQEVDPHSGRIAFDCSIRVGPDGDPMLAWYLESGTYLRYAILRDGAWFVSSVDGGSGFMPGKWNSMVLDSNGFPHIAYSAWPLGELKYAQLDGKGWRTMAVDAPDPNVYTGGQRGMGNALILQKNGSPMISYYDEESIRVARLQDGVWKRETVEKLPTLPHPWGWNVVRSSLVLDSKGRPHIGFESQVGLEHAWWDGAKWRSQVLVPTKGYPHFENSMTIDRDDTLFMAFRDPADGSLRVAIGRMAPAAVTESRHVPAN